MPRFRLTDHADQSAHRDLELPFWVRGVSGCLRERWAPEGFFVFLQIRVRPVGLAPEPGAKLLHLATQTTRRPSWTDLPERIGTSFKIKISEQGILLFRAPPKNGVSATWADPSTIEG